MDTEMKLDSSLDTLVKSSGERPPRGGGGGGRGRGRGEKRQRNENGGVIRVARRIYVSNLTWRTSWQDLKDHFKQAGRVTFVDILRDGGPQGRSKGCGIVEFESAEEAAEAINTLHLSEVDGREIYVREDREDHDLKAVDGPAGADSAPKRGRSSGGGGGQGGGGGGGGADGTVTIGRRVYVNGLAPETSWQGLKDHFKQAAPVAHADVLMYEDGTSKGCGIVEFGSPGDALQAISMLSNSTLDGKTIFVREDREDGAVRGTKGRSPRAGAEPGSGAFRGGGSGRGGGGGGGDRAERGAALDGSKIVVHGLPWSVEWQDLKDLAKQHGDVLKADVVKRPDGKSRGFGTVTFKTPDDAQRAIQELNGLDFQGRVLSAKLDEYA